MEQADLTIGHLELGLWAAERLGRTGRRVGVDFEDWHSENLPEGPVWRGRYCKQIEARAACVARHLTTTSRAMSSALASAYGVAAPTVVYNGNSVLNCSGDFTPDGPVRLVWFSQTIGAGRGLEDAFRALPLLVGEWRLELIGVASAATRAWIARQLPGAVAARVNITAPVHPSELAGAVQNNDIGLALEVPSCRSRDLTITNKIIQYLQCGLKVAATSTAGQREALQLVPGGGALFNSGDAQSLAAILNQWILGSSQLRGDRRRIRTLANSSLAYERSIPPLLSSVENALAS
jgi:glycosyltransferase involved in cell wall biosynthesis